MQGNIKHTRRPLRAAYPRIFCVTGQQQIMTASASDPTTSQPLSTDGPQLLGQPRGLATLFLTEMWERFTYYGMRALLILLMTAAVVDGGLGIDDKTRQAIP